MDTGASSSTSAFVTSLIINGLIFLCFVAAFVLLRGKHKRIYEPRSLVKAADNDPNPDPPPAGKWSWLPSLLRVKDEDILIYAGLDSYFFLRYMKMMALIFSAACICTWPVLFPVNATGGGGQGGLNILSFANIAGTDRYYAQLFMAWIFIGLLLWFFTHELFRFARIRRKFMLRPEYSNTVHARTLLVQGIQSDHLNDVYLRELFGPDVERVWINRDFKKLQETVDKRNKLANKYEGAEMKLIKLSVKKAKKIGQQNVPEDEPIWKSYVKEKKRPTHRLKFLIGKKVDTINYGREEIPKLNAEIEKSQQSHEDQKELPSAFLTFSTIEAAHKAAQKSLKSARGFNILKYERTLDVTNDEVIWPNLRINWHERLVRSLLTKGAIAVLIIFWAIPVAAVGSISNIDALTNKVPFLKFILDCPPVILGLITGMLPSVLLAILMAVLPIFLRLMAKQGGEPTLGKLELAVQNSYFGFQVVQVFLVMTLASAASSVVTQIITDPTSATSLLAENLPKASNFYISYLLLQAFTIAGGLFLQLVPLILFYVLGKLLDNTPRKVWTRWNILSGLGWGTVFPVYTNLAVIGITYSIIAPLIMIFAALTFVLIYYAYLYDVLYVYKQNVDTKGMIFPRAIWQSFTGLYLLEICLTGLFGVRVATPQIVLMAITIPATAIYQIWLQYRVAPELEFVTTNRDGAAVTPNKEEQARPSTTAPSATTAVSDANGQATDRTQADVEKADVAADVQAPPKAAISRDGNALSGDEYHHPAVTAGEPYIWIPRDELGVSQDEINATREAPIRITDDGAAIDEKAKLATSGAPPDYEP